MAFLLTGSLPPKTADRIFVVSRLAANRPQLVGNGAWQPRSVPTGCTMCGGGSRGIRVLPGKTNKGLLTDPSACRRTIMIRLCSVALGVADPPSAQNTAHKQPTHPSRRSKGPGPTAHVSAASQARPIPTTCGGHPSHRSHAHGLARLCRPTPPYNAALSRSCTSTVTLYDNTHLELVLELDLGPEENLQRTRSQRRECPDPARTKLLDNSPQANWETRENREHWRLGGGRWGGGGIKA